jgi:hypothetical protein
VRTAAASAILALAAGLLAWACGIRGPARPPLPPVADGGPPRTFYEPLPPGGDAEHVTLRWRLAGAPAVGRLSVEEHLLHAGDEGSRCKRRRVVALVPAAPEVAVRVARPGASAQYRLLGPAGEPISGWVDVMR